MVRTKKSESKKSTVMKSPRTTGPKQYSCFVCPFTCIVRHNYKRHLARIHKRMEDGTKASDEYCERFINKRTANKMNSASIIDSDTDVEPTTPPHMKYVRRLKEARNDSKISKSESHTTDNSPKINLSDKAPIVMPRNEIKLISNDPEQMADETARAVANIPGIRDSISAIRDILSHEVVEEPFLEIGVSANDIFDLLGEETQGQSLNDIPLGLGWTLSDDNRISAFSVQQRPIFTNREDIWAAPVSEVVTIPTQVSEVTSVSVMEPPVISSVAPPVVSNTTDPVVSSFGNKPLFSVANVSTDTSVTTSSGCAKPIVVQAEIHPPPSNVKTVVRSKVSKETRDLQTGAIADVTVARIKHISLSPERDTGPYVRQHSVPVNPASRLRSRSVENKTEVVSDDKFAAALTGSSKSLASSDRAVTKTVTATKTRKTAEVKKKEVKEIAKVVKKDQSKKVAHTARKQSVLLPTTEVRKVTDDTVVQREGISFSLSHTMKEPAKHVEAPT